MSHVNILRVPDRVTAQSETEWSSLTCDSAGSWHVGDVEVVTSVQGNALVINVSAPVTAVKRIRLRWQQKVSQSLRVLSDTWERAYGDLGWRSVIPERPMPWYFLAHDGRATHGYGVKTASRSLCFWQLDSAGTSLVLDIRSGGAGIELGQRRLEAARVVTRQGTDDETAFEAATALCKLLCEKPRLPAGPVYGCNDFYYAYGQSSHETILRDAERIAALSPSSANRPYAIIDGGWQLCKRGGPWRCGNERFPDMPGLAAAIRAVGARPGIWLRPLKTNENLPAAWFLKAARFDKARRVPGQLDDVLDPSIPDALEVVREDIRRFTEWGYELIKFDWSTFDLLGMWSFNMGAQVTPEGWSFADRSRTSAEIVLDFYRAIREAAGSAILIGCTVIGHLAAGLVELQRTGDDTSGLNWEKTRKMGINTLAFRMPQHGVFYACDADCVGLTGHIPWDKNRQWLELLAGSGTPLFVSISPDAVGPEQEAALKDALALAAREQAPGEPLDWMDTTCPSNWRLGGKTVTFDWFEAEGAALY